MKKFYKVVFIIITVVFIVSCGSEKSNENYSLKHLQAYFFNNGFSQLNMYGGDTIASFSNAEYIIGQMEIAELFVGAEDYKDKLLNSFNELYYNPDLIGKGEYQDIISLISQQTQIEFIYFTAKVVKGENGPFVLFPVQNMNTGQEVYFNNEIRILTKKMNKKILEGTLEEKDTLIEFYGDEEDNFIEGELISSLEIKGNKGFTKRETKKGIDENGVEFTTDVDVYYTGEKITESKLVGGYLTSDKSIIVVDDINYMPSNLVRPRIRKFNEYGLQQWTYCVKPCGIDSLLGSIDDLSYYSMIQIGDTLSITLLENDFMFTFYGYGNGGEINPSKYKEYELNILISDGQLISFREISEDESIAKSKMLETYIREKQILVDYTLATSQNVFPSKGKSGEKFQYGTIKNMMVLSDDDVVEIDINYGMNILGEKFHYLRQHNGDEASGFRFFHIPDDYSECNCEND